MYALLFFSMILSSSITCYESEPGAIMVDGIIDDWENVEAQKISSFIKGKESARGNYDFRMQVKCVYNHKEGMFLLINVVDSVIIRTKRAGKKGDRVEVRIGKGNYGKLLKFYPPAPRKKAYMRISKRIKAKIVKLKLGYAIEIGIPWGFGKVYGSMPKFPVSIIGYDSDSHLNMKPESILSLDGVKPPRTGWIVPDGANRLYQGVIDKLGIQIVYKDMLDNFVQGKNPERLVWGDNYLVLMGGDLGTGFLYVTLAQHPNFIEEFKIVDLDGDKIKEVFTKVRMGDGSIKSVVVWRGTLKGIKRMFAHLVEFHKGPHYLINTYKLKPKGRGKKRYYVIYFKFQKASSSITKQSWKGTPPDDNTIDFLFPWGSKKEKFVFSEGSYYGGR